MNDSSISTTDPSVSQQTPDHGAIEEVVQDVCIISNYYAARKEFSDRITKDDMYTVKILKDSSGLVKSVTYLYLYPKPIRITERFFYVGTDTNRNGRRDVHNAAGMQFSSMRLLDNEISRDNFNYLMARMRS